MTVKPEILSVQPNVANGGLYVVARYTCGHEQKVWFVLAVCS